MTEQTARKLLVDRLHTYMEVRQEGRIPADVPALIPIEEVLEALDAEGED
jgi:hypothetical protein